jgi:hypothetical protein
MKNLTQNDLSGLEKAKEALTTSGRPGAAAVVDEMIRRITKQEPAKAQGATQ